MPNVFINLCNTVHTSHYTQYDSIYAGMFT